MDKAKKSRTAIRSVFTRNANQLETLLSIEEDNLQDIKVAWLMLQQKEDALRELDKDIFNLLIEGDATEEDLEIELSCADEYNARFAKLKTLCDKALHEKDDVLSVSANNQSIELKGPLKRKFKLPVIETKKFGGDIRDWLPFWSQFKKIHDDPDIPKEDKFQYLLQATIPNTRGRELVESFPPIQENYDKAIESLKTRFGRDDLIVEFYVRELLKLVLNNTLSRKKESISTLYDKIELQLRALETLGVTSDKCTAMLYPLVESCLSEELLRVWQRSPNFSTNSDDTLKNRLNNLMMFLKSEVENEERISLAVEAFGLSFIEDKCKKVKPKLSNTSNVPTAAGLMNYRSTKECIFCTGTHQSAECFKAQKLSMVEKRKVLTEKKACFSCLRCGHRSKNCKENLRCVICNGKHVVLMCPDLSVHREAAQGSNVIINKKSNTSATETVLANCNDVQVFLQTMRINIRSEIRQREVRVLIDSGSQRSYILTSTAEKLEYSVKRREKLVHALFGGVHSQEQNHSCFDIRLSNLDGSYNCRFEALDQPVICNNISSITPGEWQDELLQLGVQITDTRDSGPIEVLIGADVIGKLLTGRRHILKCGLVAVETLLGWTLIGKVPHNCKNSSSTMTVMSLLTKDILITNLWQLDVLGIADPTEMKSKQELDTSVNEYFQNTIRLDETRRYEVRLLWIEDHPPLSDNYIIAKRRLDSVVRKLQENNLINEYEEVFDEWLAEGIIEEVPVVEVTKDVHYLPHRPVIKLNSTTTKIRPVFDASAHGKGEPSLNNCLEKGLNLIELIPSILMRFRINKIGVVSDIRKAFLQIGIHKDDRDFLRFLWKRSDETLHIYRHKRVVFGVCCSPYLLGATIKHHLNKFVQRCELPDALYSKKTILKLLNSFYVDNCVASVDTEDELEEFIQVASQIMADGKFDLRGWQSTSTVVDGEKCMNVLGMKWNREKDTLAVSAVYDNCYNVNSEKITKRYILSAAQSVFDPLGFVCPVTLCPKILLQNIWKCKISWDEEVDSYSKSLFLKWYEELPYLAHLEVPRWIALNSNGVKNWSLHTFSDASLTAYAAVVFLRVSTENGVQVHLLQAKTRVAPLKKLSIPRLELLAATIAVRLFTAVKETLKEADIESHFWSDSSCVLSWINREDEWATFVWNRIKEIRSLTSKESWHHVPGNLNPADLPSRGCTARSLLMSRWWEGPQWLSDTPENWPNTEVEPNEEEICKEQRKKIISSVMSTTTVLWYSRYFSQYNRIVRLIAWIRRFYFNCKFSTQKMRNELTAIETINAEKALIKLVQKESFEENNKTISFLNPFVDEEGIIRLRTKISNREDSFDFRYPIVMPAKHIITERLIYEMHVNACHVGIQGVQCLLREHFWILGGRKTIRNVIRKCVTCKRQNMKGLKVISPPLPLNRVRDATVFEITGVDLAGPLYLKTKEKTWICLFTCAIYRAVHFELVMSLSTSNFLQAFRRFVSRRGRPNIVYSDNGTNFVGLENAFSRINWEEIKKYSAVQRIKWNFNPPTAAWWGGWWERLVSLLKQLLRKVLGKASLSYEELNTILCDCEAVINSRPITYISDEPTELVALTPAMFLRDQQEIGVPDFDKLDSNDLNKRLRFCQRIRADLRRRFRIEYLGQLRQTHSKRSSYVVSVGDVVLIENQNLKRLDWPMGKVEEVIHGKDGEVRLVRLRTVNGLLLRPIQRIFPLEKVSYDVKNDQASNVTSKEIFDETTSKDEENVKTSRIGRKIKRPDRLNYTT